jgi:putative transcriptional regulator
MTRRGGWPTTGFGQRLRDLRETAGLSQAQLADRVGCNRFTVAKTERGEQEPAWPLVLAFARALGVSVVEFDVDLDILAGQSAPSQPSKGPGRPRKTARAPAKPKRTRKPKGSGPDRLD